MTQDVVVAKSFVVDDDSAGLAGQSAMSLAKQLQSGEVGAVELLEETIERTEQVAAALNPIALRLFDHARTAALRAERDLASGRAGPLCGVPITVKDSQWYSGVPCANGSRVLADFVPQQTSAAIRNLEAAGAVVFAKTTCPELSLLGITQSDAYGITRNPWNPSRTSGGSSGGGAVAVATGLGPLSLGGDGGGSIRIPASFCGVVGFKPSFGLVPKEPGFGGWESLVSYGPMARSVADARLMLGAALGPSGLDELAPPSPAKRGGLAGVRLVVTDDLGFAPVDADVRDRFWTIVGRLEEAGAELVHATPGLASSVRSWATISRSDTWQRHIDGAFGYDDVGDLTRLALDFGARFDDEDRSWAAEHREVVRTAYGALFERTGAVALLTPTLGCEAFPVGQTAPSFIGETPIGEPWFDWVGFLYDANLTGMPACAVPVGLGDERLPISLQVQAPVGQDLSVLAVAEAIETAAR